jgi:hypothetical protein
MRFHRESSRVSSDPAEPTQRVTGRRGVLRSMIAGLAGYATTFIMANTAHAAVCTGTPCSEILQDQYRCLSTGDEGECVAPGNQPGFYFPYYEGTRLPGEGCPYCAQFLSGPINTCWVVPYPSQEQLCT